MTKIWHNPRCRKSREALNILEDRNEEHEVFLYLETPPSKGELMEVLQLLGIKALDLIRRGESIFKENYKGKELSDNEWVDVMIANPKLIERPIVIKNGKAVIGRPPESVLEIL